MSFCTDQFQFNKQTRTLLGFSRDLKLPVCFPDKIEVKSVHTGRVVEFEKDIPAAIANDFWDGEQCMYFSYDTDTRLVLVPY
jgi:hypothetical protein